MEKPTTQKDAGEAPLPSLAGSARPIGFPPQVWDALIEIRYAQQRLEDDYPNWNESGKKYAVESSALALRRAHQRIMHYVKEVEDATK